MLKFEIREPETMRFRILNPKTMQFEIREPETLRFEMERYTVIQSSPYTGAYDVDPQFIEQTLDTKDKRMADDVTVRPIEVQRVSNDYGKTVYIGGIING